MKKYTIADLKKDIANLPDNYELVDWSNGDIKSLTGMVHVCDTSNSVAFTTDAGIKLGVECFDFVKFSNRLGYENIIRYVNDEKSMVEIAKLDNVANLSVGNKIYIIAEDSLGDISMERPQDLGLYNFVRYGISYSIVGEFIVFEDNPGNVKGTVRFYDNEYKGKKLIPFYNQSIKTMEENKNAMYFYNTILV